MNWLFVIAVLALVLAFRSSEKLAAAYGVAVIGTITVTTTLFFTLQWVRDRRPHWQVAAGARCSWRSSWCSWRPT